MEEPTINRPTPMTSENPRLLQEKNYGLENFLYGDNWLGTALYYYKIICTRGLRTISARRWKILATVLPQSNNGFY